MDVVGWKGSKGKHRLCKASNHLLPWALSLPVLFPGEAEEIPKPLLSSTEGLGAACCAMPTPRQAPGSHQHHPDSMCWESREAASGSESLERIRMCGRLSFSITFTAG